MSEPNGHTAPAEGESHRLASLTLVPKATVRSATKDFKSDQEVRWCPGCGDYAILAAFQAFLHVLPRDLELGEEGLEGGEDGVVAAAWAPADFLVGLEIFFGVDGQSGRCHFTFPLWTSAAEAACLLVGCSTVATVP